MEDLRIFFRNYMIMNIRVQDFEKKGLWYEHRLIDYMVEFCIKSSEICMSI